MATRYPLQETALAVVIGTPLLAACFVGLRVYARKRAGIYLGWNDYLIILANILSIGIIYPSVRHIYLWHVGIHIWQLNQYTLEPEWNEEYQVTLMYSIMNTPILPLVKASIILLLLKAAWVIKPLRLTLYAILTFVTCAAIASTIALMFRCPQRTAATTLPTVFNGLSCLNYAQSGIVVIAIMTITMFTDLLIFPIPILLMRGLRNASWRDRVAVVVSFTLVLGASAIGAVRLYLTYRSTLWVRTGDGLDWTYNIAYVLQHAENNVAIILACAPPIRTLVMSWAGLGNNDEERVTPGQSTVLRQRVIGESLLRTIGVRDEDEATRLDTIRERRSESLAGIEVEKSVTVVSVVKSNGSISSGSFSEASSGTASRTATF